MSLGLSNRLSILHQSPHDLELASEEFPESPRNAAIKTWVPSRYTFRAKTADNRLVLWNSYTGAICVFNADQAPEIESILCQKGYASEETGAVKYLYNRGFITKEGTDEYARFQLAFGQRQYQSDRLELILLASEDCNFRCVYCYEKFARGTMRPEVRQGIKKLVKGRLPGLRTLSISWFGGEPLYGFQAIEDLAPFFWDIAQENSMYFRSHMTTNGYLLTPEIAEKLLAWRVNSFQVTLDGPPECHDHSRQTRNGEKSFDVIFSNLKALSRRTEPFQVFLRMNFTPKHVPHMDEFLDLVEREFREDPRFRMRFRAVGKWGGANDAQMEVCGLNEGSHLILEFEKQARERGLALADGFKASSTFGAQVCYAARPSNFIIGATGKLMKCTVVLDHEDHNVVGMITSEGRLEIDQNKLAPWVAPYFESDTQCQRCTVLPVCQGISCPLPRVTGGGRPCIPTRSSWKKELLAKVEQPERKNKRMIET